MICECPTTHVKHIPNPSVVSCKQIELSDPWMQYGNSDIPMSWILIADHFIQLESSDGSMKKPFKVKFKVKTVEK